MKWPGTGRCGRALWQQLQWCADRVEKDKQFNALTEAAGELMSLGFEDIYQDTKSTIAAGLHK